MSRPDEDFEKIRKQFPFFSQKNPPIYLDSAATTHKPERVIQKMDDFYRTEYSTVNRSVYKNSLRSTEKIFQAREKVAAFIHAESSDNIVFTKGTTEALNLIAFSFARENLQSGDSLCVIETEHHANIVPWQIVAKEKGADLIVIPVDDQGKIQMAVLQEKLSPRTKLVCVAHMSNVTGIIHPIAEIAALAHAVGAVVVVDGAQSVSQLPIDVQKLGADFFVFSGHKLYGPTGVGVLYGKKEILEGMVPYQTGGDMIEKVTFENTTFRKIPYRFEAGTPMIAEIIGLSEAIDFLNEVGMENIAASEKKLLTYLLSRLSEIPGIRLIGEAPSKGAMVSFVIEGLHHLDIGSFLDSRGIAVRTGHLCAQPTMERFGIPGAVRVSLGIYNCFEDIDRCIEALKECLKIFQ